MGWLHSRPKLNDKDNEPKARIESLKDGDPRLDLPDCDPFIAKAWHELGMCSSGSYGYTSLSFVEIKAYSDSACALDEFDVSAIAKMSRVYVSEQAAATKDKLRGCGLETDIDFYNKIKEFNKAEVSRKMRLLAQQAIK